MSTKPNVTLVMLARDRFCYAQESLESIYKDTDYPFKAIYVDGGSPKHIANYLRQQSEARGFQLIRVNHFLAPNRARNIAMKHVDTEYVVFVDNDVIVTPGWLKAMIDCADETCCAVVCPLTCEDRPIHETIHYAGGEATIEEKNNNGVVERHLVDKMYLRNTKVSEMLPKLKRISVGFTEFHCFLVRTEMIRKIGMFDDAMPCTKEHTDFAFSIKAIGGEMYFEPKSLITFVSHVASENLQWSDVHYYMLRWSDAWEYCSLRHFVDKWRLTENQYFKTRFKTVGWRRKAKLVAPYVKNIKPKVLGSLIGKILGRLEKVLNVVLTSYYGWRYGKPGHPKAS